MVLGWGCKKGMGAGGAVAARWHSPCLMLCFSTPASFSATFSWSPIFQPFLVTKANSAQAAKDKQHLPLPIKHPKSKAQSSSAGQEARADAKERRWQHQPCAVTLSGTCLHHPEKREGEKQSQGHEGSSGQSALAGTSLASIWGGFSCCDAHNRH